jgi:hypothetical protein
MYIAPIMVMIFMAGTAIAVFWMLSNRNKSPAISTECSVMGKRIEEWQTMEGFKWRSYFLQIKDTQGNYVELQIFNMRTHVKIREGDKGRVTYRGKYIEQFEVIR